MNRDFLYIVIAVVVLKHFDAKKQQKQETVIKFSSSNGC